MFLVVVLAVWLSPLGRIVNLLFAIAAGYLTRCFRPSTRRPITMTL